MKLYIMRHGQTAWNEAYRLQGCVETELNENGIALAKAVGKKLDKVRLDCAFTSPLKRAVDTARYVVGERNIPIIIEERIKEISFGDWEGCCIKPDQAEVPMVEFEKFLKGPAHYVPPVGGETITHLCDRAGDFIDELLASSKHQAESILITAHGAAVRAMMYNLLPTKPDDFWRGQVPPNCALNIFEIVEGEIIDFQEDVLCEQL